MAHFDSWGQFLGDDGIGIAPLVADLGIGLQGDTSGIGGGFGDNLQPAPAGGGISPINLSSLLGFGGGEELDGMGDLFRTLLALQGQSGGKNDFSSLFSGIEL